VDENPAQAEVLAVLGARPHERPAFDPRLRTELRQGLERRLAPVAERVPDGQTLWVSKHLLSSVHGCEGLFLAQDEEEFAWTPQTARGTVAHKAIELSVHWQGDPVPAELVDESIALLINGTDRLGEFLGGLRQAERAELRSEAVERTTMFLECFPPLKAAWRPVTESRLRVDLCGDRVRLQGKVDLALGRSEGTRAGKVLIDLKTGGFAPSHHDDLRFYALLETLGRGVPPRLLASYYLDGGSLREELVTEDLLRAALERAVQGAGAIVDLRRGLREPEVRVGPACSWCVVRDTCAEGTAWLAQRAEDEGW
jgi:hypothetical protein